MWPWDLKNEWGTEKIPPILNFMSTSEGYIYVTVVWPLDFGLEEISNFRLPEYGESKKVGEKKRGRKEGVKESWLAKKTLKYDLYFLFVESFVREVAGGIIRKCKVTS